MVGGEEAMLPIDLTLPPVIVVLLNELEDLTSGEPELVLLLSFIRPNGPENFSNHSSKGTKGLILRKRQETRESNK